MLTSKVFAAKEEVDLKPEIIFELDCEYSGQQKKLVSISGTEKPLDPDKIIITYEGVELNGHHYQKTSQAPQNAGSYTVTVTYAGDENYEKIKASQQVRIRPLALKSDGFFTHSPLEKTYDGTRDSEIKTIEDLNHHQILEIDKNDLVIEFQRSRYLFKDVNPLNKLILSGIKLSDEKSSNYKIEPRTEKENEALNKDRDPNDKILTTDVLIDASIEKKPLGIYLTSADKSYDGTADLINYGFTINQSDLIPGEKVEIQADSGFSPWYGLENSKIKDVGSYRVYAQDGFSICGLNGTNGDNYKSAHMPLYSHIEYQINPVEIIVSPAYRYKYEGQEDPLLVYSVWRVTRQDEIPEGLFKDDRLYGSLQREKGETPGRYDIYQGDLNNSNYIILFEDGDNKFEILTKDAEASANIEGKDYFSNDSTRGKKNEMLPPSWNEIVTPSTVFGGGLIMLIIVIVGVFYVRNKMTNFD